MSLVTRQYFDCRRYIKPGDRVEFNSMWGCSSSDDVARRNPSVYSGNVTKVYERFVMVKLKRVEECVNRCDILSINGKKVTGVSFRHCEVRI